MHWFSKVDDAEIKKKLQQINDFERFGGPDISIYNTSLVSRFRRPRGHDASFTAITTEVGPGPQHELISSNIRGRARATTQDHCHWLS